MKVYTSSGIEIYTQRGEELTGLLHLLHPLDQMAHPHNALIVGGGDRQSVFVFPVRRDALFRDSMHILRTNLHLEGLAGVNHRGVQRLIQVRARHRYVVFESAGHRAPQLMHHSKRGVAILHRVGDHAHGEQVVNLIEHALLLLNFQVERVETLGAALNFGGKTPASLIFTRMASCTSTRNLSNASFFEATFFRSSAKASDSRY